MVAGDQVLSVHEAADCLGVSMERVRQMIYAGQLAARRSSAGWLIPAESVAQRSGSVHTGRPLAPQTAWAAIAVLAAACVHASPSSEQAVPLAELIPDRRVRHRVLRLLASLPDPVADAGPWRRLLSARGQARRLWAHAGVLDLLAGDSRVSRGGAAGAAPADHDGLTARPGRLELYVSEADAQGLIRQYRMRDDNEGQVHMVIVPASVPPELAPGWGTPAPAPAAASDLLEEDDPRAHHAAAIVLQSHQAALRAAGWLTASMQG